MLLGASIVLAGATTSTPPRSISTVELSSTCAQYALYTWASLNSVDGTPDGLERSPTMGEAPMAAIDRAHMLMANPNDGAPDVSEMTFDEAACYVQHGGSAQAISSITTILQSANLPDGRRNLRNYAWQLPDVLENEAWRELAIAYEKDRRPMLARNAIRIAYFDYPNRGGHSIVAQDLKRLDAAAFARLTPNARTTELDSAQKQTLRLRGTPCIVQHFAGGGSDRETWWYCDSRQNYIDAYLFGDGHVISHFAP